MAKDLKAFIKTKRRKTEYRPVCERVKDYGQVAILRESEKTVEQSHRCMDCGTPFCHWACPVGNVIPEWNDLAGSKKWDKAYKMLSSTNNLPEITGRVCPALCEYSCVLGINDSAITVRENELGIIEYAFKEGWVKPYIPKHRTGKKVAVVGSGPAGLAAASELNKLGHTVTVFERDDRVGGILRYGIPDFKLEKSVIDRRVKIYEAEGIIFKTNTHIGKDYPAAKLAKEFDAVCLTGGSREARDMQIEGRELKGIHLAMDYLTQSNKRVAGVAIKEEEITAKGKKVVVIGGGDTGSDCVGTANRQGASCVVQIEVMPKPAEDRPDDQPWPKYPMLLKTTTSHEEGSERKWSVLTKKFVGERGHVKSIACVQVEFIKGADGRMQMKEVAGSDFVIEADLVVLAVGFVHPEHKGMLHELALELDPRGNVKTADDYMTSRPGIFAAGDMRRGQSLVVWAIAEGRNAAYAIDKYLSR